MKKKKWHATVSVENERAWGALKTTREIVEREVVETQAAMLAAGLTRIVGRAPNGEALLQNAEEWRKNPNAVAMGEEACEAFRRLPAEEREQWRRKVADAP